MNRIFGTDIGGVLAPSIHPSQVDFVDQAMLRQLLPRPNAFRVISRIANELLQPNSVYVVSYCDQQTEQHSRLWLKIHDFHEITKIPEGNLFYCRERRHKNIICQELGITDFVDDNIKVLLGLETVTTKFLFRHKDKNKKPKDINIQEVWSWTDIEQEYF